MSGEAHPHRTGVRIARGIVTGVVAGAIASFVMDRFQALATPLLPSGGQDGEPATEQAASAIARDLTGREVAEPDRPLAGQAVHYLLGIGLGVAYGVSAEFRPEVTSGYGSAFGIGAATLLDEGVVPAMGWGSAPWKTSLSNHLYSYASHLVFGATGEFVRRQVAATLTR